MTRGIQMKITVIYGQNHKGSTYHIAHDLALKLNGEIKEFQRIFHKLVLAAHSAL